MISTKVVDMSTTSDKPIHHDSAGGSGHPPSKIPFAERIVKTENLSVFRSSELLQSKSSVSGIPSLTIIAAFERAARDGDPPLGDYLSGEGQVRLKQLVELTHSALEMGIRAGRSRRLADYIREYPELASSQNDLAALIETEVRSLMLAGKKPEPQAYEAAYPALESRVRDIFRMAGCIPALPGYEVFEELGRGGMGVVYRARQSDLHRDVALKVIRPDRIASGTMTERYRSRFRREAAAVATINHPNVVQIFEAGETIDGSLFLAMELVDGPSLQQRLDSDGVLAPRDAAELLEKVAKAVAVVHTRGIVHRDLKPDNVLLTSTGIPKVADFGLAKPVVTAEEHADHATQAGVLVGTPEYMSPEQAALTGEAPTPLVDVYGLGALLYACLTGRPPVPRHAAVLVTLEGVRSQEVTAVRILRPDCPKDLETICLSCLEKDPTRRYQSAAAVADDLRRFLEHRPIMARPVGKWERSWKWIKRNPVLAASLLAILFGTGIGIWSIIHTTNERAARIEAESKTEFEKMQTTLQAQKAEASKVEKEQAEQRAARLLDLGKIRQSFAAWQSGNPTRAKERLNEIKPQHRGWEWRHLDHVYRHSGGIPLRGHDGEIKQLQFAASGRLIVTGGKDGTIRVWDSITGTQKHLFKLNSSTAKEDNEATALDADIKWLRVGPGNDERTILALSRNGALLVGDLHTGKVLATVDGLEQPKAWKISPDWQRVGIVSGLLQESLTVVELRTGRLLYPRSGTDPLTKSPNPGTKIVDSDNRTFTAVSPDCLQVAELRIDEKASTISIYDVTSQNTIHRNVVELSPLKRTTDGSDPHFLKELNQIEAFLADDAESPAKQATLDFDASGKQLIVRHDKQKPLIMDARNGKIIKQDAVVHQIPPGAVAWLDDRLAARLLPGNRVQVINLRNTNDVQILAGSAPQDSHLLFCPQGLRLAAISPTSVSMWDLQSGTLNFTHKRHSPVNFLNDSMQREKLVFAPNGKEYALQEDDAIVTLRDTRSGMVQRTLLGHDSFVRHVKFSPDSRFLAVVGEEDHYVWDLQRPVGPSIGSQLIGKPLAPIDVSSASLAEAVFGASSTHYEDPQIDTEGKQVRERGFTIGKQLVDGVIHGRGLWLRTLDLESGKRKTSFRVGNGKTVTSWRCLGKWTVLGCKDGTVSIHDASSGLTREWKAHTSPVQQVAIDVNGEKVATASARMRPSQHTEKPEKTTVTGQDDLMGWNPEDGPPGDHFGFNEEPERPSYDIGWAVWDSNEGRKLATGQFESPRSVSQIDILNDSSSLVLRCDLEMKATDGQGTEAVNFTLVVFDLATVKKLFQLDSEHDKPFNDRPSRLTISPDARTIAVSSIEGKVQIIDGLSKQVRLILPAHPKWVTGLIFDPTGQRLVTAGAEGSVRIWDLDTGLEVFTLQEPGGQRVTSLKFSRDGCWLFGTTITGQVITWQASLIK